MIALKLSTITTCLCVQSSCDFSQFNVQYYIQKLEDLTEYNFPFTRIKQVEKELAGGAGEEEKEEPKTEEIKEEEEKKSDPSEDIINKLKQKPKQIDLESIEEGELGESN